MKYINFFVLAILLGLMSCSDDDVPAAENEEEVIDQVILTFTPASSNPNIVVTAVDPDGDGAADFTIPPISLSANETYILSLEINNASAGENITDEIKEEAEEHMIFFGFTAGLFSSPTGNGNIDSRNGEVNYDTSENDANGNPLGLTTIWQTASTTMSGEFRLVLKHQPAIKSATSTAQDGETDIDLTFDISIN